MMMTTGKQFLFKLRQILPTDSDTNVLSSVILSRLYGAHAKHIWQYCPLNSHDILQGLVALRWRRCIRSRHQCNEKDD